MPPQQSSGPVPAKCCRTSKLSPDGRHSTGSPLHHPPPPYLARPPQCKHSSEALAFALPPPRLQDIGCQLLPRRSESHHLASAQVLPCYGLPGRVTRNSESPRSIQLCLAVQHGRQRILERSRCIWREARPHSECRRSFESWARHQP